MGYAKYVGRVGALAVTLGVGMAMASTPGIAYAEPSGPPSSTSDSSSTSNSSSTTSDGASTDGSEDTDSSASDPESPSESADGSTEEPDFASDDDSVDGGEGAKKRDSAEELTSDEGYGETPPAADVEDTAPAADDGIVHDAPNVDSTDQQDSSGHRLRGSIPADTAGVGEASLTSAVTQSTKPDEDQSQMRVTGAVAGDPAQDFVANVSADAPTPTATTLRTAAATTPMPVAPVQRPTLVNIVSDLVAAALRPFMSPGTGFPFPASLILGVLSAVRNEIERALFRRTAPAASKYTVAQLDPTPNSVLADPTPNVLVIGVDGTNLSRILADDENDNFFAMMDDGTTAASSIVGHTTISGPSWSAILTGVWGERTGVINNVFTPWTYDKWPTVFNQLEMLNPNIDTTAIANWNVINAISGAGSIPADTNVYIPQIEGDTNWLETDDAVGDATVDAIENTAAGTPSFLFSYFVGVDENGHLYGGASPQYAEAINNVDDNLGEILAAVQAWETANPDEGEWTIIVVTDHGHQPQKGFGHGFQTPDETATFVIARGADFNDGYINLEYEIVDTTPTVVTLFGGTPPAYSDGVSLTTLGGSDELPDDLHQALEDAIAMNHSPDIVTDVALGLRTIFATIPYYVWILNNDGTIPIPILGDVLYVVTNIPAQIVARLTGVTGASIFPLFPPGPPSWPGQEEATVPDTAILACSGDTSGSSAAGLCDAGNVA